MLKPTTTLLSGAILAALSVTANACAVPEEMPISTSAASEKLSAMFPVIKITSVQKLEKNKEVFEVTTDDGAKAYVTADGNYLMFGKSLNLLDISSEKPVNVTQKAQAEKTQKVLGSLNKGILIEAPNSKTTVRVFTDVNCPVCRSFDKEVSNYLAAGISVEYHAFPFKKGSKEVMEKVWCAEDPVAAIHAAKTGETEFKTVESPECKASFEEDLKAAEALGIRGTPTIFLEDGKTIGGYMAAEEIKKLIFK